MRFNHIGWKVAASAAVLLGATTMLDAQRAAVPSGFTSIFDGRTLNGWEGDLKYFTVRDGAIVGGSDKPISNNTYLILKKPYADFELRYKYRWATETGNSGIQFRSGRGDGNYVLAGMQANNTPITPRKERFGMLYEELGDRQEMVLLGQHARVTRRQAGAGGQGRIVRTVLGTTNPQDAVLASIKPYPQWNEVVLIAHGDHIVHVINGLVAFDAIDDDPLGRRDGLIGIQVHSGQPMSVEFRDMVIRPLTSFPNLAGRYTTNPGPAPAQPRTYKDSTKVALTDPPLLD